MVKSVFLQDGEEIFVDDEDYERVNRYKWFKYYKGNTRYIHTRIGNERKGVLLTTFIKEGSFQKNKNNNFTKSNLTTKGNRSRWGKPKSNGSSKYKGVNWRKDCNKWTANINVEGNQKRLGIFKTEELAAEAYNKAVDEFWGGEGFKNIIGRDMRKVRDYFPRKNINNTRNASKYGYRGIGNHSDMPHRFSVRKKIDGKLYTTEYFDSTEKAALAYNKIVLYLFGDDAILNEVPMTDELKEFISNWEIPDKFKALKEGAEND
ncbi:MULTISPECIES: AP2 domain-containing protein [Staphylococcus]|uniref:AP2 domain-containing protein n=1 Tax=Staphylococcus TaxID=1279 RepID=UPI00091AB3DB|nr:MULTISPECIES: AP2 domain-containing protein [Staphylococcus]MCG9812095.1 AP2 domain-containing protein [Staphylococcus argenteus]SGT34356.1 AP2 domain [Staphylococcus aureus]